MASSNEDHDRARPAPPRDEREFVLNHLARQYADVLGRFFARRLKNRSDADDLVQEVFLRLSRLKDLNVIENPEQYLFATAASAMRDRRRRDVVRKCDQHLSFDNVIHGGSDFAADRVYEGRQALEELQKRIRELPERTRDIFVLRTFEDVKSAEIARALGISQRAVEKHYAKAMGWIAASLKEHRG